jgi:hypothetical protein
MIECPNIGEIAKIKIGHNDKGPGSGFYKFCYNFA